MSVCADLGGGVIRGCGPHGSGVAAMTQFSQSKASKCLHTDTGKYKFTVHDEDPLVFLATEACTDTSVGQQNLWSNNLKLPGQ